MTPTQPKCYSLRLMHTPRFHLLGLRHLALWVRDMGRSRGFYQDTLGLKVVWEPDPDNVYLSSGADNLALHQIPEERLGEFQREFNDRRGQSLDHFGFLVESPEAVEAVFEALKGSGAPIVKPLRTHRDRSVSFYTADPDGHMIQILYEPHASQVKT